MDYSQLSPEKQAEIARIKREGAERIKQINRDAAKGYARIALGGLMQGASMLPIMNIPYIGTGLGGALFEAGQGVMEGKKAADIARQASKGFAIGETVGAIPYAGKAIGRTKAGAAVGDSIGRQVGKLADTQMGRKAVDIGVKVGDALMTDIKAFNPNKQIAYHGSPYDFNKFSNEAIGTGEGAQAHGMGHYTALDKDVADTRYRKRLVDDNLYENVELNGQEIEKLPYGGYQYKNSGEKAVQGNGLVLDMALNRLAKNGNNVDSAIESVSKELDISNPWKYDVIDFLKNNNIKVTPNEGQLYKLSVPKDDVMLREDLLFSEQPQKVQDALKKIYQEDIENWKTNITKELENNIGAKNILLDSLQKAKEKGSDRLIYAIENDIKANMPTYENNIELLSSRLANEKIPVELNRTGEEIYNDLRSKFLNKKYPFGTKENRIFRADEEFEKEASDLLNQNGIKGISYNGGIDGEARVIFNPDDIDIVRKFYNKPGALEYLKRINPNIGAEAAAIDNNIVDKNYWKQYAKDNFIGNSVNIPGYTTVNFTNNNLMRDYPYNMPEYPSLFEQLMNSKYGFSTNYNKEKDRLYDHLINNDNNRLFDYLIEVIQDNDGNIHHNYKMMKNIMRGDKP